MQEVSGSIPLGSTIFFFSTSLNRGAAGLASGFAAYAASHAR
jgi:hypothetical protein